MNLINDTSFALGWVASRLPGAGLSATFIVKGAYSLVPGGTAEALGEDDMAYPKGAEAHPGGSEESLHYESDYAPMKLRSDLMLVGTCHAPGGDPVEQCEATFQLGGWKKSLRVVGDRAWESGLSGRTASRPQPFTSMPMRYENAFGGVGYGNNPIGKGYDRRGLPNIEHPRARVVGPDDRPEPAGFGPLNPGWSARAMKPGDPGKALAAWPWFPDDFDWSHFNAAPADQQVNGFLRGDEPFRAVNLHAQHPAYECRLPGQRPQLFVRDEHPDGRDGEARAPLREVKLNLDTLWVDMDAERLVLVWRGHAPVRHVKLDDIEEVHVHAGAVDQVPLTPDEYASALSLREAEDRRREAEEAETERAEEERDEREFAALERNLDGLAAKQESECAKRHEQAQAWLAAHGMEIPAPGAPLDRVRLLESLGACRSLMSRSQDVPAELHELVDQLERDIVTGEAPDNEAPFAWTRERVLVHAGSGIGFREEDLTGIDLSGADLAGADLAGATLAGANLAGAALVQAKLADADLSGANLAGADLSSADLSEADLTGANLEGAVLARARLNMTILCGVRVGGACFDEAHGELTDFSDAAGPYATFNRCRLVQPDFSRAALPGVEFVEARVSAADFGEASAPGIKMIRAEAPGLRAGDAPDFSGGDFRGARAEGSFWEGANLDRSTFLSAVLARADFTGASLRAARLDTADLRGASFEDACLSGASLERTNVFKGSFERCDLRHANLSGSNLYEAEFWDAQMDAAVLHDANLTMTKLEARR